MATTLQSILLISYYYVILVSILRCKCEQLLANDSNIDGFTTDLIHIDSPASPLYDPSLTPSQRLANARHRSLARFNGSKATAEAAVTNPNGAYLIQFFMGTPIKPALFILDTGSDLIWTQCRPCRRCIRQRFPIFNPQNSSSYRAIPCSSRACRAVSNKCDGRREKCQYSVEYQDGSYSNGPVASETFVFHSSTGRGLLSFPGVAFGCGHDNFFHAKIPGSGIAGLGFGRASLVHQLGYTQFSYCLFPDPTRHTNRSSKLHLGANAAVSGAGVVWTPLSEGRLPVYYYYLTLEAITVGNKRIEYHSPSAAVQGGNIIIDSGALVTALPVKLYDEVEEAIANSIRQRAVRDFLDWRLCYSEPFVMPRITVHFKGADVEWRHENAFIRASEDYECLAVDPVQGQPVYGAVAQGNYLVGYDLRRRTLSFKQTQCA